MDDNPELHGTTILPMIGWYAIKRAISQNNPLQEIYSPACFCYCYRRSIFGIIVIAKLDDEGVQEKFQLADDGPYVVASQIAV